MNKMTKYIQSYIIVGFPFVLIAIAWDKSIKGHRFVAAIQEFLTWHLVLWFLVLILFLIILVIIPKVRELTLRRLANITERDEREEYITGKASRFTYISTLSLLLFLFFNSIFSLNIKKIPDNQTFQGKHRTANINLSFHVFEEQQRNNAESALVLFDSTKISLSKSSILLILICWQLTVFSAVARREQIHGIK